MDTTRFLLFIGALVFTGTLAFVGYWVAQKKTSDEDPHATRWEIVGGVTGGVAGLLCVAATYWAYRDLQQKISPSSRSAFTPEEIELLGRYGALPEHVSRRSATRKTK